MRSDPIDRITWLDVESLNPNGWNPNVVFTPELTLLERSIIKTGWTQPILVNPRMLIIDGFHRWRLSMDSPAIREIYAGKVPCAIIDVSDAAAMAITVRMNRAKGDHVAVRMSSLVKRLIDDAGWERQEVAIEIGATVDEVDLLYQDDLFKSRNLADYKYSRAWVPAESQSEQAPPPKAPRRHSFLNKRS